MCAPVLPRPNRLNFTPQITAALANVVNNTMQRSWDAEPEQSKITKMSRSHTIVLRFVQSASPSSCIEVGSRDLARVNATEVLKHLRQLDALLQCHAKTGLFFHAELHAAQVACCVCGAAEPRWVPARFAGLSN